jgi:hypothetical protein
MNIRKILMVTSLAAAGMASVGVFQSANAATAADLDVSSNQALERLYKDNPTAAMLSKEAKAVLNLSKYRQNRSCFRWRVW